MNKTTVARKTATAAPKAPATKAATRKAPATKAVAPKAATRKAPVSKAAATAAPAPTYATITETAALANMIRGLNERVEALESANMVLTGQCTSLENVIIGLQTAALTHAAPVTAAPATKAAATEAPVDVDLDGLIDAAIDSVLDGINSKRWNTNVIQQCDYDLRAYADNATRKALKTYRETSGMTLAQISQALVDAFNEAVGPASDYNKLTLVDAVAMRSK